MRTLAEVLENPTSIEGMYWRASVPPGIDTDTILVNEQMFARTRLFAGISEVAFMGTSETDQVNITASMNDDGSATSAKAKVVTRTKSEMQDGEVEGSSSFDLDYRPKLAIYVSQQEILDSLTSARRNVSYTEHYATSVSKLYRGQILNASINSNVLDIPKEVVERMQLGREVGGGMGNFVKVMAGVLGGLAVYTTYDTTKDLVEVFMNYRNSSEYLDLIQDFAWGNGFGYLFIRDKKQTDFKDLKWSMFNWIGPKFDRLAVSAVQHQFSKPLLTVAK